MFCSILTHNKLMITPVNRTLRSALSLLAQTVRRRGFA
jgi:hypothetical protein